MADLGSLIITGATGIVGGLLGASASVAIARGQIADARKAREEATQDARKAREDAARIRSDDFQRNTLLDFQEALGRYVRSTGQVMQHDRREARAAGKWVVTILSDDLNQEHFESGNLARQLALRIRDDELRARFTRLNDAVSRYYLPPFQSEDDLDKFTLNFLALLRALEERLGEVLRPLL